MLALAATVILIDVQVAWKHNMNYQNMNVERIEIWKKETYRRERTLLLCALHVEDIALCIIQISIGKAFDKQSRSTLISVRCLSQHCVTRQYIAER